MDPSIKEKLEQARLRAVEACRAGLKEHGHYNQEVADIVLNAGNLISRQAKLDHLWGDRRWKDRKEVIKQMIESDTINPNTIQYQHDYTPMEESITFNDVAFTTYLLSHGATPLSDQEKLKLISDWEPRKKLIKKMISVDHIDPNTIKYVPCIIQSNPLYDSYDARDVAFAQYLLNQGADPDKINFAHDFFKDECVKWLSQNRLIPQISTRRNENI